MLNRYWREYPLILQMLLFSLLIFLLTIFFMQVVSPFALKWITGVNAVDITLLAKDSPKAEIRGALLAQGIFSASVFLLPSLLFVYQTTPNRKHYLGLRPPGESQHWLYTIMLMLGVMPVMLQIQALMRHVNFGPEAAKLQAANDRVTEAFLQMPDFGSFVLVLVVLAIVPAIGEELFFRGIIMRFMAKRQRRIFDNAADQGLRERKNTIFLSIFVSAILFTMMHSSLHGFLSIFLAGLVLGWVYYLTGSLWCSILAHLINNGLQIVLVYFSEKNTAIARLGEDDLLPWSIVVGGLLLAIVGGQLLWKSRTPLAPGWTDDYLAHEKNNASL